MSGVSSMAGSILTNAARRLSFSPSKTSFLSDYNNVHKKKNSKNDKNVGILGFRVYTPRFYCNITDDDNSTNNQTAHSILCGDVEDINSMSLTALQSLLETYDVDPRHVGRLDVVTNHMNKSYDDASNENYKSMNTRSVLLSTLWFSKNGCTNDGIEGTSTNTGGSMEAVINAVRWIQQENQNDKKYAIVLDVWNNDTAATAILIGANAPLALSCSSIHTTMNVVGNDPDEDYKRAFQTCYNRLMANELNDSSRKECIEDATSSPYHYYLLLQNNNKTNSNDRILDQSTIVEMEEQRQQTQLLQQQQAEGEEKKESDHYNNINSTSTNATVTAASISSQVEMAGNLCHNNIWLDMASYLISSFSKSSSTTTLTTGKTIVIYTQNSDDYISSAAMYKLRVMEMSSTLESENFEKHCDDKYFMKNDSSSDKMSFTMKDMVKFCGEWMSQEKTEISPKEWDYVKQMRTTRMLQQIPYSPVYPTTGTLPPGTYYLTGIDSRCKRSYSRIPLDAYMPQIDISNTNDETSTLFSLAPPIVHRLLRKNDNSSSFTGETYEKIESSSLSSSITMASQTMKQLSESSSSQKTQQLLVEAQRRVVCVITGVSAGLPGCHKDRPVFHPDNLNRLLTGEQCIEPISGSGKAALLDKNVVQIKKMKDGTVKRISVDKESSIIKLAAQLGNVDLTASYGVPAGLAETMDVAAQVAVAAGLEALKSAGLVPGNSNDLKEWKLPEQYRDSTGVVYASSFPAMDAAVGEVMRFLQSKTVGAADIMRLISALRNRLIRASPDRELSNDDEAAFARLLMRANEIDGDDDSVGSNSTGPGSNYIFDRKFLFRVLVLGNAQLAQLAGCRGPNTQTNAACAGTTQAIGMAQDMLISGRAERVVVIAGDNASGETLLPWLGSGFRALGAATTQAAVENAALPFDKRRSGMILGAGGIGLVLETEFSSLSRQSSGDFTVRARLLATQYSNSAYHGAALNRKHIASELSRFLKDVELVHGISKEEVATHGVYFSHETSTHASSASSCAGNEVAALRESFGDSLLKKLLILNTKGFTGHPMGVSFEDVTAVQVLLTQVVPPVANYQVKDDYLGDINVCQKGGPYACRYALRFAAGFGSQVAFALYATAQHE